MSVALIAAAPGAVVMLTGMLISIRSVMSTRRASLLGGRLQAVGFGLATLGAQLVVAVGVVRSLGLLGFLLALPMFAVPLLSFYVAANMRIAGADDG
jgi:hypothetical protein